MKDKIEIVKSWIDKGDHDLGTAQITFMHIPNFRDTIAFHCQQAVEKYLKALLIFYEIKFRRTHDLNYLLSLLNEKIDIRDVMFDKTSDLTNFSIEVRYPDSIIELTNENIKSALSTAKEFREFVLTKMNLSVDQDNIS